MVSGKYVMDVGLARGMLDMHLILLPGINEWCRIEAFVLHNAKHMANDGRLADVSVAKEISCLEKLVISPE